MDIDKILLILERIEVLGVSGKKIMADGKVNIADLPEAVKLLSDIKKMMEAFSGAKEAFEEMKDLDSAEGMEILKKLYEVGKNIEKA